MITLPKHTLKQIAILWQGQARAAADKPWLFTLLMRQWTGLYRRFAYFYQRLMALPRPHKRALKRNLATTLAGAALLLALGQPLPAHAATITVDGVTCTLAEAIDSANNNNAMGNGCIDGNGEDTIDLQTNVAPSGLPDITSKITLNGDGHFISGDGTDTVLQVSVNGNLILNHATITRGGHRLGITDRGGGIHNDGTLTLNHSTISGNTAMKGGGIYNSSTGHLYVNNSTLSGNDARPFEGNFIGVGGAIFNAGRLTVNNSTITGNSASENGGGIYNTGSNGIVNLNRSLISGNSAPTGAEVHNIGTVNANNYNVVGYGGSARSEGLTLGSTDIVPVGLLDTVLNTTLAKNGGPTQTHALAPGSEAIDVVPSAACIVPPFNADQRGRARNVDGDAMASDNECDAGAFEFASEIRP